MSLKTRLKRKTTLSKPTLSRRSVTPDDMWGMLKRTVHDQVNAWLSQSHQEISNYLRSLKAQTTADIKTFIQTRRVEIRGKDGKDGKDGAPGRDGKDGKHGLDGFPGRDGTDGKDGKDGSPDTPDQIITKIHKSDKLILQSKIRGLEDELASIKVAIRTTTTKKGGGGMGNWQTDDFTGDGSTTAFTLSFNVASSGTAIIVLLNGQVQEQTTHYTVSGKTLTFTTAPFNNAAIHAWYSRT